MTSTVPQAKQLAAADQSATDAFPLDRYLARIGYDGPREPSLAVLQALTRLQSAAIAYENLDPLVGNPVSVAPADLIAKLLPGKRGGYCFELNGLLALALTALGFSFVGLAARVLWGQSDDLVTARSHQVLLIDLPEGQYIADVGFGSATPTAALRLVADEVQATPHGPMRLIRRGDDYYLQARLRAEEVGADWRTLYRFDLQPQHPVDYVVGNHYVATFASSIFRLNLMAARHLPDCRLTFGNNTLNRYALDGTKTETVYDNAAAIRTALLEHFALMVPDAAIFDQRVIELGFVTR